MVLLSLNNVLRTGDQWNADEYKFGIQETTFCLFIVM